MSEWRFLTNHALVLRAIARQPRITAREISMSIGITERATRNIITDLDNAGYITKKREGRRIKYRVNPDLPLGYETENRAIGDLLEVLGWKRKRRQAPKKNLVLQTKP